METPFENDPFSIVWKAFKKLYPDKNCKCFLVPEIESDENEAFGCTEFWEDGNIVVFVKATLSICDAAEILAHELAHVAVGENEGHGEAWEKAFDDIHKEYERIGETIF